MLRTMKFWIIFFLLLGALVSLPEGRLMNESLYLGEILTIVDVTDHGAVGDGRTSENEAFKAAWRTTCSSRIPSTLRIPSGKSFLLNSIIFRGPCESNKINVEIEGNILAPRDISKWEFNDGNRKSWIGFSEVHGLRIHGSGTVDGQGSLWWVRRKEEKMLKQTRRRAPTGLTIGNCKNVHLEGLHFRNSPQMHIAIEYSKKVYISGISIRAAGDSPNTDGIHIGGSQNVNIRNCHIGTGDDCISIGPGSSDIHINTVTCGPGHGISVGSLGKKGDDDRVERVYVKNSHFFKTSNGIRIKTWQGGHGFARNFQFHKIVMHDVVHPIIIDQYYCDSSKPCLNQTSAVHVSNIRYRRISGTTKNKVGVTLACSQTVPCTDIFLNNINIKSHRKGLNTSSYCLSAHGSASGQLVPPVPCLAYN